MAWFITRQENRNLIRPGQSAECSPCKGRFSVAIHFVARTKSSLGEELNSEGRIICHVIPHFDTHNLFSLVAVNCRTNVLEASRLPYMYSDPNHSTGPVGESRV